MTKPLHPTLELVSSSKPIDPPAGAPGDRVEIPIAEPAELADAAASVVRGESTAVELAALIAGYEARQAAAKAAAEEDAEIWDSEDVICRTQPALAVYANDYGGVVIRAQGIFGDEADQFVTVGPAHLAAVIARLKQYLPK